MMARFLPAIRRGFFLLVVWACALFFCVQAAQTISEHDRKAAEVAELEKQYNAVRAGRWTANARQFYTGNASMSRVLFIRSGGFDESFRRAEDVELAYRLEKEGVQFEMNLDAIGFHRIGMRQRQRGVRPGPRTP